MSQPPTFSSPHSARPFNYTSTINGLEYGTLASIDHPRFEQTFRLFDATFRHHGECFMDRSTFDRSFKLNDDTQFQHRYGPSRLMLAYAYDPAADRVVGGTGFTAMVLPEQLAQEAGFDVMYMGAYVFVDRGYRGGGQAMRLVDFREGAVQQFAVLSQPKLQDPARVRLIAFNEQNDPRLMSLEDIRDDLAESGTHPCDRVLSSRKLAGWRAVDARFHYVEIDRPGDPGIDTMLLNVKGRGTNPPPPMLPTSLLCHFLERHAAVRRFGEDPHQDPAFSAQIAHARSLQVVMPFDDSEYIRRLRPLIDAQLAAPSLQPPELPGATEIDASGQAPARQFTALQRSYRHPRSDCPKRLTPSMSAGQGVWPLLRAQYKR
jgi:hypothetical protein